MKILSLLLLVIQNVLIPGSIGTTANDKELKDIVKGRVTNADGSPIANAKVVVENTIYYASYVFAATNNKGEYAVQVPNGSWKASVVIEKEFLGKPYKFDLHPDNPNPFAGTEGAIRNFSWKLSGAKPEGGYYGCNVGVYGEPGSDLLMENVELTLTPEGPLVDGTPGSVITKKLIDIGGGEDGINDLPLGRYIITAKNIVTKQNLKLRYRNAGSYANSLNGIFTPGLTGNTSYQIIIQVK